MYNTVQTIQPRTNQCLLKMKKKTYLKNKLNKNNEQNRNIFIPDEKLQNSIIKERSNKNN